MSNSNSNRGRVRQWVEDRFPLTPIMKWSSEEEIPGGSRFAYVLGSATLFILVLQIVTGVWQMFYYVPTVDHAYDSVMFLRLHVPLGWLVHGLHYWGANAFVVVMGLHIARVFIWGAYKKPRELTWIIGVVLLLLGAAFVFTGAILPWDTLGYWAGEVGTSIAGTVPIIGDFTKKLVLGGSSMGQMTLSRAFVVHVALIPALTIVLVAAHLVAFRQYGSVGPWKMKKKKRSGWFWPEQSYKDLVMICVITVVLVVLSAYVRAPITGPADPLDNTYAPKPEWNFLFLYEALKVFKGPWEQVGTVGIPILLVLLLFSVPFIDRSNTRDPLKRPLMMIGGFILVGGICVLTIMGMTESVVPASAKAAAKPAVAKASPATAHATAGATALTPVQIASVKRGRAVFNAQHCIVCHTINGTGGKIGPNLSHELTKGRQKSWLTDQVKTPTEHNPHSIMPSFKGLTDAQINDLTAFLLHPEAAGSAKEQEASAKEQSKPTLIANAEISVPSMDSLGPPGPAVKMIGDASHGRTLFEGDCVTCHGPAGKGHVPNPGSATGVVPPLAPIAKFIFDKDPLVFAENVDRFLQHGATPAGPSPMLKMPAFGDTRALTQEQIANIEAYILSLNHVDRAKIIDPGVEPKRFANITLAIFPLGLLAVLGLWVFMKRPQEDPLPDDTEDQG